MIKQKNKNHFLNCLTIFGCPIDEVRKSVIKKLTPRQREAIFFKFYENMSYEEISNILGITTKATYKLIARAITELRSAYKEKMV